MSDLIPNQIDQITINVHGASAELMMAPPSNDLVGDTQALSYLSSALVHRGAHGIRVRNLISAAPDLVEHYRIFFPITAPSAMRGAGDMRVAGLEFDYQMLSGPGSVPRVVVYDGRTALETFTEFPHNGGHVQLAPAALRRFRDGLGVGLIINAPLGQPVALNVEYLRVQLATPRIPEPGDEIG